MLEIQHEANRLHNIRLSLLAFGRAHSVFFAAFPPFRIMEGTIAYGRHNKADVVHEFGEDGWTRVSCGSMYDWKKSIGDISLVIREAEPIEGPRPVLFEDGWDRVVSNLGGSVA